MLAVNADRSPRAVNPTYYFLLLIASNPLFPPPGVTVIEAHPLHAMVLLTFFFLDSIERKVTTVKSTKNELINLIRSLISFGNTLGELPRERILNIKVGATM